MEPSTASNCCSWGCRDRYWESKSQCDTERSHPPVAQGFPLTMGGAPGGCNNPCQGCFCTGFSNDVLSKQDNKSAATGLKVQLTHFETQYWPTHHWRVLGMCLLTSKLIESTFACAADSKQVNYDWKHPQHQANSGSDVVMHMFVHETGTFKCAVQSHFTQPCLHHAGQAWYLWLLAYKFGPKALQGDFVEQQPFGTCVTFTYSCNCPCITACLGSGQNTMLLAWIQDGFFMVHL